MARMTDKDWDHPQTWAMDRKARKAIDALLLEVDARQFPAAYAAAVDTLTKLLLLTAPEE